MAIETPARIAILGAGPIGLEAALYGRFLGYDVDIYERGEVGEHVRRWGHVRLFSPFGMNASSLGLAAIAAQDADYKPPAPDELLSGREFVERYLVPLAQTDLLADSLHLKTEVLGISRGAFLKGDHTGSEHREDAEFLLLLRDASGCEHIDTADVVIDATGTYGRHNWAGIGGMPAVGELALSEKIEYGLPDVLGQQRATYAGRHTLLIGGGYSAATAVAALAELADQDPNTRVTWITRKGASGEGPIPVLPQDRLSERHSLAVRANQLASGGSPSVTYRPAMLLSEVAWDAGANQFRVRLAPCSPLAPREEMRSESAQNSTSVSARAGLITRSVMTTQYCTSTASSPTSAIGRTIASGANCKFTSATLAADR